MTISNEAVEAAKEAMCEVTPPPGASKADWLAEYGSFALIAGAIAAAAPFIRAEALEEAGDAADDPSCEDMDTYFLDQSDVGRWLRARAVSERGASS